MTKTQSIFSLVEFASLENQYNMLTKGVDKTI